MAPITKKRHIMDAFNSEVNQLFETTKLDASSTQSQPSAMNNVSSYSVIRSPIRSKGKDSSSPCSLSSCSSSVSSEMESVNYVNSNAFKADDLYPQSAHDSQMFEYESCKSSSSSSMSLPLLSPQYARVNRVVLDKNSDEYRKRRERNNIAVKKSRTKSKIKNAETMKKVNELKHENESLRSKVTCLATELRLLKNVLAAHASSAHGAHLSEFDIKLLTSTETLSLASPSASPVPSPPINGAAGTMFASKLSPQQQNSHLNSHHPHHHSLSLCTHNSHHVPSSGSAYDSLRSPLVQPSSFRDSLIRESIIHRNRMDSLSSSSSSSSSSSISPIMSPSSPSISHSMLEPFYLTNGISRVSSNNHNVASINSDNNLLFKRTRPRMSPAASLNSFNSRSSSNDSEDDY